MDLVGKDDKALLGAVPMRRVAVAEREPREDALSLGADEPLGAQITPDAQQAVVLGQVRIRKYQFIFRNVKNHGCCFYSLFSFSDMVAEHAEGGVAEHAEDAEGGAEHAEGALQGAQRPCR